jgi:hypothetical protein
MFAAALKPSDDRSGMPKLDARKNAFEASANDEGKVKRRTDAQDLVQKGAVKDRMSKYVHSTRIK